MLMRRQLRASFQNRQCAQIGEREDLLRVAFGLPRGPYAAVRNLAADECNVLHSRESQVGDVLAVTQKEPRVFFAQQAGADPAFGRGAVSHRNFCSRFCGWMSSATSSLVRASYADK